MAKQAIVRVFKYHNDKGRNNAHCNGGVQYFQYVLQHFHGLSVLYGGVLADSVFRWYLYEAGRLNEYVLFER